MENIETTSPHRTHSAWLSDSSAAIRRTAGPLIAVLIPIAAIFAVSSLLSMRVTLGDAMEKETSPPNQASEPEATPADAAPSRGVWSGL